jgi:hypothetical protein
MDQGDKQDADPGREKAMALLNVALAREGYEAFYAEDRQCYLKHIATNKIAQPVPNPHRPFSATELKRRGDLIAYLDRCSEDDLIGEVLLPLLRQLGFHPITAAGHKDKALEYGKDIWMKYKLPTMHTLYFGIQAKKDKLDAAGDSKESNKNIAEIYQQVLMMLGHEIFDPETNSRVLVDHAFIVAGGEITKAAKNWLGRLRQLDENRLERSRWRVGHCLGAEQPATVAEVRLGHKEGGSCDPFTQEDAGRTPAAQLFRGHDPSLSASGPTVRRTLWKISRQVRAR